MIHIWRPRRLRFGTWCISSAPGLRVAGVTAPGLPGVVIGHNDRIAWGFTNVGPDVQDLYLEKFDPANPHRYLTPQGWRDAVVRNEEIRVRKGFGSSEADIVSFDVTVTRHGPIILERDSKSYALRWTALDPKANNADSSYLVAKAQNWKEFTQALRSFTAPTQNIVYADVDGHIGYYAAGVIPIRKSGDGNTPYDGSTDAGEWTGWIPSTNSRMFTIRPPELLSRQTSASWAPTTRTFSRTHGPNPTVHGASGNC